LESGGERRRFLVQWVELDRKDRRPFLWVTSEKGLEELRKLERLNKVKILNVLRV
jgi:hypothetical protein